MSSTSITHRENGGIFHAVLLSLLCVVSYWVITHLLPQAFSVSRDDNLLGGMWAVVATIFVYRHGYEQSAAAALSRISATLASFVLCLVYLLFLPPNVWGMGTLIGIGAVGMLWLGRPDDVITTGITTAVVMVVAAISPDHAWRQPILRLVDTIAGTSVGLIGAWITTRTAHRQSTEIPKHAEAAKGEVAP